MSDILKTIIEIFVSIGIALGILPAPEVEVLTKPVLAPATTKEQAISRYATSSLPKQKVTIPLPEVKIETSKTPVPKGEMPSTPLPEKTEAVKPEVVGAQTVVVTPKFKIKEVVKNIKKEVDYSGQERKIISLDIVFENPKLVLKDGEWGMDVSLSAETTAPDGSRPRFFNSENISRVNFSSPYKLNSGTFVLNESLETSIVGIYTTKFKIRDANSLEEIEQVVTIDLNI